jgi:hypothetical protein
VISAIQLTNGTLLVTVSEPDMTGYPQVATVSAALPTFINRDALLSMVACLIDEAQRQVNEKVRTVNLTYAKDTP